MQTKEKEKINLELCHLLNDKRAGGIKGVWNLFKEQEKCGSVFISRYIYEDARNPLYNLRLVRDGLSFMRMYDGGYVRMHVRGELMMSDTVFERHTNSEFINAAKGNVLIAGLGIGMVLHNILDKPEVTRVTVVEINKDVITLVGAKFQHEKLTIVNGNIFTFNTQEKYDAIYFDIWPTISQDNLEDMRKLHIKFRFKKNEGAYVDSWMRTFLKKQARKEKRNSKPNWWR
jgi:hypothetical protein